MQMFLITFHGSYIFEIFIKQDWNQFLFYSEVTKSSVILSQNEKLSSGYLYFFCLFIGWTLKSVNLNLEVEI